MTHRFLIADYRVRAWQWESMELVRKLCLTSILALIAPGSAGQIVVGLLMAFALLIANLKVKPYAVDALNGVNQIVQLNLFFVLLVALLLKARAQHARCVCDRGLTRQRVASLPPPPRR